VTDSSDNITRLLQAAGTGNEQAEEELLRAVYAELRQMAQSSMARTPPGQTLQPTALVHEAYVKLVGRDQNGWENRGHFFFAASRAMRDILVDRARAKAARKRGGDRHRVDIEKLIVATEAPDDDLVALDDVLKEFESRYPWEHRIVMLRFFGGLTNEETAEAMSAPLRSIERDWRFARAWLRDALLRGEKPGPESSG
jgi:RNA polymerase sigma factor (TIGR02999 family)